MRKIALIALLSFLVTKMIAQCTDAVNSAPSGTASASSEAWGSVVEDAIDNNTDGVFGNGSVWTSSYENNPWWQVDLGTMHNITKVVVWNRTDCCSDRLNNAIVEILDASNNIVDSYTIGSANTINTVFDFGNCNPKSGQRVRIRKVGLHEFNFAEMQVFTVGVGSQVDSDNDGTDDCCDLDDDNDGILDTDECFVQLVLDPDKITRTLLGNPGNIGDYNIYEDVAIFQGKNIDLKLTVVSNSDPSNLDIVLADAGDIYSLHLENTSTNAEAGILFEFIESGTNNLVSMPATMTWSDIDDTAIGERIRFSESVVSCYATDSPTNISVNQSGGNVSFTSNGNGGPTDTNIAIKISTANLSSFTGYFRKRGGNTGYITSQLEFNSLNTTCLNAVCKDTDNDGIEDHLDLDSDNDGCPDAVEGGGSFGYEDIQNDSLIGGVDSDGIPIAATSSGQSPGTAYDSTQQNTYCFLAIDSDGDLINNLYDLDDDNDGIPDEEEATSCAGGGTVENNFFFDDFGASISLASSPFVQLCYEDGTNPCGPDGNEIGDGEYNISDNPKKINSNADWTTNGDHTGNYNGRMIVINADLDPDTFYIRPISGFIKNVPVTGSFWVRNNIIPGHNILKPDITASISDANGTILGSVNTGDIPEDLVWYNFTITMNPGVQDTVYLILENNGPGGGGNDLSIDDISFSQFVCDCDNDGIANHLDLDSDNDGLLDVYEAGHTSITVDANGRINGAASNSGSNGLYDNLETTPDNGIINYTIADSEATSDGTYDICELDADDDGCYDTNEEGVSDSDDDGIAGTGVPVVDANGLVTSITYSAPTNGNWQDPTIGICLTEICNDGIDNDGDGLIDCEDPECAPPTANPTTLTTCDNSNETGSGVFFLHDANNIVTSVTGVIISYHPNLADAQNDVNQLISPYTSSDAVVYTRVENTNGCYATALITLNVGTKCVESCVNGIDDDGDGLVDTQDSECPCSGNKAPQIGYGF